MTTAPDSAAALLKVRQRIARAAQRVDRDPASVRLIAVSKKHGAAAIERLVALGQTDFGENQIQEALTKTAHFRARGLSWHFIGHLQSNKARLVPGQFDWVHSIDSEKTARRIAAAAEPRGVCVRLLLQVNVSNDPAKHGVHEAGLFPLVERLLERPAAGIVVCGLMTIGRLGVAVEDTRRDFARLRTLLEACRQRFGNTFSELSMGMSSDYEIAVEEGATMVRVGSALFGARQ
jgi:pyridoxal phosphate enzyme (YggS family)